ncbi:MAG TPA: methyltransferase domain-containing protein [Thermoleophilaceae bacterium]|nr:methyltransferase domain-containing protein [Thermoleophilaceae bacterium]
MAQTAETVRHPIFARLYMLTAPSAEGEYRRELLAGLTGQVIEVGAGHGLNFAFYPEAIERVLAVEPEPLMRKAAAKAAADAPVAVEVVDGVAGRLPTADASVDAAVASLVLCSVPDQQQALAELHRVIRPGGELRFYEHVIAQGTIPRRLQRLADATFWPHVAGGCHLTRDTGTAIEQAGFEIESKRRFNFTPGVPVPPIPHILGIARRP